jgi:hypothetical protein
MAVLPQNHGSHDPADNDKELSGLEEEMFAVLQALAIVRKAQRHADDLERAMKEAERDRRGESPKPESELAVSESAIHDDNEKRDAESEGADHSRYGC